jgi:hypothetical protein
MANLAMVCKDCVGNREMETKTLGYMKEMFTCDICKQELNFREKCHGFITWGQFYGLTADLLSDENTDVLVLLSLLVNWEEDDAKFHNTAIKAMPELLRLARIGREVERGQKVVEDMEKRRVEREKRLEELGFEIPTKEEMKQFVR